MGLSFYWVMTEKFEFLKFWALHGRTRLFCPKQVVHGLRSEV